MISNRQTFYTFVSIHKKERTKPYVLILSEWWNVGKFLYQRKEVLKNNWYEFDTLASVNEFIDYINEFYKNQLLPIENPTKKEDMSYIGTDGDFTNGGKWWGYIVLDYTKSRIHKFGGTEIIYGLKNKLVDLEFIDICFRRLDEIPENYKWDEGEYEGWLQFRWGDGKNAIDYVEPKKPKKHQYITSQLPEDDLDFDMEEYIRNKNNW